MSQNPSRSRLIEHLKSHAVRTDGPFTLRSGEVSDWYIDARQTTFDGVGARLVGAAVLDELDPSIEAVGGLTMGADPIALATAMASADRDRPLRAFSIRIEAKEHGTGGRMVGPLRPGDHVAVMEDTTTTGSALVEAIEVLESLDVDLVQAVSVVDRSDGVVAKRLAERGIAYTALVVPADLGVGP